MGSPPQPPAWMEPTAPSLAISLRDLATVTMATQSPATGPTEKGRGPRLGQGCECEGRRVLRVPLTHPEVQVDTRGKRSGDIVSVTNISPKQPRHHNTLRDRKTPGDRCTAGERNSTDCTAPWDTPPLSTGINRPPANHLTFTTPTAFHMRNDLRVVFLSYLKMLVTSTQNHTCHLLTFWIQVHKHTLRVTTMTRIDGQEDTHSSICSFSHSTSCLLCSRCHFSAVC